MRVIAGIARGVPLKAPKGLTTRPTADRVRESLFNILGDISGARVLDLFAGSGALGLEALSRGAAEAVFIDKDRQAVKVIRENLGKTKLQEAAKVLLADTLRVLAAPGRYLPGGHLFDLAFVDPPYAAGLYEQALTRLGESGLLTPSALVVVEQPRKMEVLAQVAGFKLQRSEGYGDTTICFYRQSDLEEEQ